MRLHQNRVVQTAANTSISPLLLPIIAIAALNSADYLMLMRLVASPDPTVCARSSPNKKPCIIAVALSVTTKLPNLVAQRRHPHQPQLRRRHRSAAKKGAHAQIVATVTIVIRAPAVAGFVRLTGAVLAAISMLLMNAIATAGHGVRKFALVIPPAADC